MRLLVYDFEVFSHDWLVVIVDVETRERFIIYNNKDKLFEFYAEHIDDIWVGYNSRMYDQFILKGILSGLNPYVISNEIVNNNKKGNMVVPKANLYKLNNFDVATGFHSLKQLEGFMGSKIKESDVSFDINRPLNKLELKEVVEYCIHDVNETIKVFNYRKEEYDSQLSLIKAFNLDMEMFTKTKTQLAGVILDALKTDRNDEFNISIPDTLKLSSKYQHIVDWYKNPNNMNYKKKLITDVAGVTHIFAFGGLHGAIPNYTKKNSIILMADVASLYPALMIEYGYVSRNIKDPSKYIEIRDTRLKLKAEKNPMQLPYKIVLNGSYGAMKFEYNPMYDPLMANNVCIAGQLLLLDLIEKVEPYCKLIQSNTDGIFLHIEDEYNIPIIKEVAKEWEKRVRLDLEWEVFDTIYQKDVNNYIVIDKDKKYKSKGSYVKKLSPIDYDLPIINKALVEYFVHDTPIEDTINNCNELIEFQKIVKVSNLYKHAIHNNEKIKERVLRVFASKKEEDGTVFKIKDIINEEDNSVEERYEKIANTPENCVIYNESVINKSIPDWLDKQYYIDIGNKRLFDFLDDTNVKKYKLSSRIKGIPDLLYDEVMEFYNNYNEDNFVDFLNDMLNEISLTHTQLLTLISLDEFNKFGKNKGLLNKYEIYNQFINKKQIKIKDIDKLNINESILQKYSNNKTEKMYKDLDMCGYIKEVTSTIDNVSFSVREQIKFEIDKLGETSYYNKKATCDFYFVLNKSHNSKKTVFTFEVLQIQTGNKSKVKVKDFRYFVTNHIEKYNILKVEKSKYEPKTIMVDGQFKKSETEKEQILTEWKVY